VEGMKWLLGTYTSRFNRKHKCRNQSETKFPLTPTLSPEERANRLARLG
jgi:hypothetical protein